MVTNRSKLLSIFLAFLSLIFSPVYAGSPSESGSQFDDGGDEGDGGGFDIFGIPILFPYADYHRGRKLIQLPPRGPAAIPVLPVTPESPIGKIEAPCLDQIQLPDIQQDEQLRDILPTQVDALQLTSKDGDDNPPPPALDKYNRRIVTLDHGSPDNPYLIQDHGILNFGLLGGVSFNDTQTYVLQYNALAKFFYTTGGWSERWAPNYDAARNLKKLKTPTKPKHFDEWDNGDDIRMSGSMAVALYAGVSIYIADARAGSMLVGNWAKHITRLDKNLVRIAFTRQGGGGATVRIQPLPLSKIEGTALKDWEGTLVYTFDRSTKEGKKALKHALHNRIFVKEEVDQDNVTLLTQRSSGHKKISRNLQAGIPFIIRARMSRHNVQIEQKIQNEKNGDITKMASKGRMKQKVYRHVNIPKTNKHKKWKHYTFTNYHYTTVNEGMARIFQGGETKKVKRRHLRLTMEISFTHDRVKVKKFHEYNRKISKKVGFNDLVIDADYKKNKQIGYTGITYRLNVGTEPLLYIINEAVDNKHLFDDAASHLIATYFATHDDHKSDPHDICRGKFTHRNLCISFVKFKTHRKLDKISSALRKLSKPKVLASKSSSSALLARISRLLNSNQFVLQSFIMMLPPNPSGYGTYELEGERFLGKKFIVDPNNQREIFDNINPDDDELVFDKINQQLRDDDYDMFW